MVSLYHVFLQNKNHKNVICMLIIFYIRIPKLAKI